MKASLKQSFQKHLQRRYSLRLHMCAILLATTLSGVLFSKGLLLIGVVDFRVRYPLAVVFSYFVFFVCIKLWLSLISSARKSSTSVLDWIDFSVPSGSGKAGGSTGKAASFVRGGEGQFSGGGASASFGNPEPVLAQGAVGQGPLPSQGGGVSKGVADVAGGAVDVLGDDNSVIAIIVLVGLIVTILISVVLVLYGAPTILAEAAFEGVLAASLAKRTRTVCDSAWAGSVFKATWKPFAFTLAIAFLGGAVLHSCYPHAARLADILLT